MDEDVGETQQLMSGLTEKNQKPLAKDGVGASTKLNSVHIMPRGSLSRNPGSHTIGISMTLGGQSRHFGVFFLGYFFSSTRQGASREVCFKASSTTLRGKQLGNLFCSVLDHRRVGPSASPLFR
jgi:hypothetical protein